MSKSISKFPSLVILWIIVEDEEKIIELSRELKQEKQKRKDMDNKFSQLQEEFADMKSTNETLQKVYRFSLTQNCLKPVFMGFNLKKSWFCFHSFVKILFEGAEGRKYNLL